jgi:type I restriction enzyme M protein
VSDTVTQLPRLIWSVADLLRGDFKATEYGKVILPFTVLRSLDCLLASTRHDVLDTAKKFASHETRALDAFLRRASGQLFYNTSPCALEDVAADPDNATRLLLGYVAGFSDKCP